METFIFKNFDNKGIIQNLLSLIENGEIDRKIFSEILKNVSQYIDEFIKNITYNVLYYNKLYPLPKILFPENPPF